MLISGGITSAEEAPRAVTVGVIAHSVSTSMEARKIVAQMNWTLGQLASADTVLVVARSSLIDPLHASYRSSAELSKDAESLMNISGPKFHIYVYQQQNGQCIQLKHYSYAAD